MTPPDPRMQATHRLSTPTPSSKTTRYVANGGRLIGFVRASATEPSDCRRFGADLFPYHSGGDG